MGRTWATLLLGAVALSAIAPVASCVGATEIQIDLTTNVDCAVVKQNGANVRVGSSTTVDTSPSTSITSYDCNSATPNALGDIVVVPSGSPDAVVSIEVVMGVGQDTATCLPESSAKKCIYARRQIPFSPHAKLKLPIFLDSLCTGVTCTDPSQTCVAGVCVGSIIDPSDCDGGTCTTPTDASMQDAIPDVPIIANDAPCTTCNSVCTDLKSSTTNCGQCGFDCSGGSCVEGTCIVTPGVTGSSLAVYGTTVYVATSTGIVTIPTKGGSPTLLTTFQATWVTSLGTSDVAWLERPSVTTLQIVDQLSGTKFQQVGAYLPQMLVMSNLGYAYSESTGGNVVFQPVTMGTASPWITFNTNSPIHVALSGNVVYATDGATLAYSANGATPLYATTAAAPTALTVDDPSSGTANVYVVEKGTSIAKYDYKLASGTVYATSAKSIGSLVWAPSKPTIVANAGSEIGVATAGVLTPVVTSITAVEKTIAVDAKSVYWIGASGGVFKHYL